MPNRASDAVGAFNRAVARAIRGKSLASENKNDVQCETDGAPLFEGSLELDQAGFLDPPAGDEDMRKSRFTEEQIAYALRQAESGDLPGERQRGHQLPARAAAQQRFVDHGAHRCGHQQGVLGGDGRQLGLPGAGL